jgi:predicted phage terminase large subunit-like protein
MYDDAVELGRMSDFNAEMMNRVISDEDRVILDSDIVWYKRENVIKNKGLFNFYITTDFATSSSQSSDYSVISVWAYNYSGDWLWVDGICARQLMDKNVNDLFRLAQEYKPQAVGIEVSGQQGGFIPWIMDQMVTRNIYFPLASDNNNGKPGIRPTTNKMQRFNVVVPWFKAKKMFFPKEMKNEFIMRELYNELSLVTPVDFKSKHDDFCDTISMLALISAYKPSQETPKPKEEDSSPFWIDAYSESNERIESYII